MTAAASRAAQGLPPTITDPAALRRIAIILNARTAGADHADRSDRAPGTAPTQQGSACREVGRAS